MPTLHSRSLLPALGGLCALLTTTSLANNIQVTSPTLTGNTGTSVTIQFDLTWANSWRGGGVNNWDAAWVFAKYRTIGGLWIHVPLDLNGYGNSGPTGSTAAVGLRTPGAAYDAVTNPVVGVFLYRAAAGSGTTTLTAQQLPWNYAAMGLSFNDITQVQVFAIEMVYVPGSSFAAGSGGTENNPFTLTTISTAVANTAPTGTGSLGGQSGGYPTGQTAPVATWPNGNNSFYTMKYEISQQGYVDFLNTLTYAQQSSRTENPPNSAAGTSALSFGGNGQRNGIDIQMPGVSTTTPAVYACNLDGDAIYGEAVDGKDIASNYLSWGDVSAYSDWSGLRPMTELEFEKACRGPLPPLANEFPWGTTSIANALYTLSNSGANNEGIATNYSTTAGNATYALTWGNQPNSGPVRAGICAAHASNTGRISAGAGYCGAMDLGGNNWEQVITIANPEGRAFSGTHGNGTLTASGAADGSTWPDVLTGTGSTIRGGAWAEITGNYLRTSQRLTTQGGQDNRFDQVGGRGVRTAP
jgi:formylglycine-generating enzyme required for sulfatase activity